MKRRYTTTLGSGISNGRDLMNKTTTTNQIGSWASVTVFSTEG
jgi:hypothetical protein